MGIGRRGIRRGAMVAVAATTLLASSALVGSQAGAVAAPGRPVAASISNPGALKLKINITLTEVILATPTPVGPMAGTATGTIDAAGHLKFPMGGIKFAPFATQIAGTDVTLKVTPTKDWTGTIDPSTGNVLFNATSVVLFTTTILGTVDCPLGPSTWNLFGNSYKSSTGKASVSDPSFDIPALVFGANAGCAGKEDLVNQTIGLPGVGSAQAGLTFTPAPKGVGITATTTTTASTSTTTTTTVAPTTTVPVTTAGTTTTGGNQLPRTGSSTMPLAFVGGTFLLSGLALVVRRKPRSA
jgi:LPXTG-motif cell wall-anchored protein